MDDSGPIGKDAAAREPAPYPKNMLVESPYPKTGVKRVNTDRYYKQEFHDREVERIWKKVWQVACREEEIPEVGDYIVYDVAHLSFIVMRSAPDEFRAYWNSCPHRGRKLKTFDGHGVSELRCMFHGWSWQIDGQVKDIPCRWDFEGVSETEAALRQTKTGTWGGWVFINPDPDCEPLVDYLGTLPEHFEGAGHDMGKMWKQVHVAAILECNWKICLEAFIESWHVTATHPQWALGGNAQSLANRWDDFGNWMRRTPARPTDKTPHKPGDWGSFTADGQLAMDTYFNRNLNEPPEHVVNSMKEFGELQFGLLRELNRGVIGDKIDDYHNGELTGGDMVSVFPNFHPWAAFSKTVYRYRPYGDDPNRCIMDVILMSVWPEDKPKPPPANIHWLKPGETTADAPELGVLGRVFLQDISNMYAQQQGVKTGGNGYMIFSDHNETPARKFHDLYEQWMGLEEGE